MKIIDYLNKSENSIAVLLAVSLVSMSFPYGFPLFGMITLFFGILKIITGKFKLRINISFIILFFCILTYMIGLSFSEGIIYDKNISDMTNIVCFVIIWILLSDLRREDYQKLKYTFARFAVSCSAIISTISLYKFYQLMNGVKIEYFFMGNDYPGGTSLVRDYNMFSLAMTTGLIMSTYLLSKTKKTSHMFFYLLAFIIIYTSILFAGSRRGWVVATVVLFFVIYLTLRSLINLNRNLIVMLKFAFGLIIAVLSITFTLSYFEINIDLKNSAEIQSLQNRFDTLQISQVDNSFSQRTVRWEYALNKVNDSNPLQLLLGSGFGYLTEFANEFNPNLKEDYPHNPFLSALLYSGIIGFIVLVTLILSSVIMLIINYKVLGIHFIFLYFTTWLYIFVSSNSIFSVTISVSIMLIIISIPHEKRKVLMKPNPHKKTEQLKVIAEGKL